MIAPRQPTEPNLTRREREVLDLLCDDCTDKDVSAKLRISEATVGAHMRSIFMKLSVHTRAGAVAKFIRSNYDERTTTNVQLRR